MIQHYIWAKDQNSLLSAYSGIIVASQHMKREYLRNGVPEHKLRVIPLFGAKPRVSEVILPGSTAECRVVFMGRMTNLKGGDLLLHAVALANRTLGKPMTVSFAGDGPARTTWEQLARRLGVDACFTGWLHGEHKTALLKRASLLAVPSVWPEPFGMVGLEAAWLGIPAIAFDVGGVREWLQHGVNGYLVPGDPPTAAKFAGQLVRAFSSPTELQSMRHEARATAERMSVERHLCTLEEVLGDAIEQRAIPMTKVLGA
jgi:glycosyltransferase involved in cell wall biosynthesis